MDNKLQTEDKTNKEDKIAVDDDVSLIEAKDVSEPVPSSAGSTPESITVDCMSSGNVGQNEIVSHAYSSVEQNTDALIIADDVIRAGGFGARDDISSFLPVASDSTDFEASLRDAWDYEEPQGEVCRPGLGWTGGT